jgi:AraC-like DNA-binding protein
MDPRSALSFVDMRMDGVDFSQALLGTRFAYCGPVGPVSLCYIVRRGGLWLEYEGTRSAALWLDDGSVVGLSGLVPHWLKSDRSLSTKDAPPLPIRPLRHGVEPGDGPHLLVGHAPIEMLAESTLVSGVGHLTPESGKHWRRIWRAVEAVEDELLDPEPSAGRDAAVRRYAELMLLNIVRWLTRRSDPRELEALAALGDQRLMRALVAAADHVELAWTVADMAEIAGMSRSTFARHFQAVTGSTPRRTVTMTRLRRAAALLAHGSLSVEEAAVRAGYASSAAFIRAFHRVYGQSPTRWRQEQSRAEDAEAQS